MNSFSSLPQIERTGPRPWRAGSSKRSPRYGDLCRFVHRFAAWTAAALLLGSVALESAQARPIRLVALGDSLTAGYSLPEKDAFPAVLQNALAKAGVDIEVVNAGVSGDTASDALERLDWTIDGDVDFAIVELGANDMLRGIDPAITKSAIEGVLAKLKAKGVRPMLAGMMAAPGMGGGYEAAFNAIFPNVANDMGVPLYAFFLDGVAGNPSLQLPDGMHPNAAGVRTIVDRILPSVKALISISKTKS